MLRRLIFPLLLTAGALCGSAAAGSARGAERTPKTDVGLPLAGEDDGAVRAFPGAEGGGMYATGGRGGRVYHVTKLTDDGSEGTLRYAVRKSGPRTIVFDVAGTIDLASELSITKGDLTIAGQTAPGDGICLRNYAVKIAADNVIVRFVRFRLGDATKGDPSPQEDCVGGRFHENIILDHRNFTLQWCLIAESLNASGHYKGEHGYGGIWGGRNASFHHNLLAHNKSRNARLDHPKIYGDRTATHRGNVDFRNNVIYNWLDNLTYGGEDGRFNIVGNYYKPGPASRVRNYFVDADALYAGDKAQHYDYPRLYVAGNYHAGSYAAAINADNWLGIQLHDGTEVGRAGTMRLAAPLPIRADDVRPCRVTTHDAATAFERVTEYAGASLRRDAADRRIAGDVRSGSAACLDGGNGSTGGIVDTQEAVGGWPELRASRREIARASTDTDGDGIPDWYERRFGLDPADAADGAAATLDPQGLYTNLEVYLHSLVRGIVEAQRLGGVYDVLE